MTPPTQSDARWEPPEWLVEKMARAVATDLEYLPTRKLILSDFARVEAALRGALSECPVLGLSLEQIEAVLAWSEGDVDADECGAENCWVCSARKALLATREALERGSDG